MNNQTTNNGTIPNVNNIKKCTKCGSILNVNDKFCGKCGAAFDGNNVSVHLNQNVN